MTGSTKNVPLSVEDARLAQALWRRLQEGAQKCALPQAALEWLAEHPEAEKTIADLLTVVALDAPKFEGLEQAVQPDLVYVVQGALNPYREALRLAGLPESPETAITREIVLNLPEEIQRQVTLYQGVKDRSGKPALTEWVDNIMAERQLLLEAALKDRVKIEARIQAGMIPVVMPSRAVQERTREVAMRYLKPIWVEGESEQAVKDSDLHLCYQADSTQKMTRVGFFKHLPDRSYLVWVEPGQRPDLKTVSKSFSDQVTIYKAFVAKLSDLYDQTDLIPTEYAALQATFTAYLQARFKELAGANVKPKSIIPLDSFSYTRFLSAGKFFDGYVPAADFIREGGRVRYSIWFSESSGCCGFRLASRT